MGKSMKSRRKAQYDYVLGLYYTNIGWRRVHYTVYGTKKSDNGRGEMSSETVLLNPPFLYEETFKYPYRWLVCLPGVFAILIVQDWQQLLLCIGLKPWTVRFCHNSTWRCRFWVSVKASRPISFSSGRSRGTNGPIRLLSCTKCII